MTPHVEGGMIELLGSVAERADGSENLEEVLTDMAWSLREALGVEGISVEVEIRGAEKVSILEGGADAGGEVVFPISRGEAVGGLSAFLGGGKLDAVRASALRAAASVAGLAVSNAAVRRTLAAQKANLSAVQLASEALGAVLDEERLYETVLLLTLELLSSTAGVVFPSGGRTTAVGFEDEDTVLGTLGRFELGARKAWRGRIGDGNAVGARIGRSGGAVFIFRSGAAYAVEEESTLKLVARQLARAQERSRIHASLENATIEVTESLAAALESRDGTTGEHIGRTQELAEDLAQRLGLDPEEVRSARFSAVLHDIGKIGVPDAILNKPGKLDEWEWEVMRRHPRIGARILAGISGFERVAAAVESHHERFDGGGYPRGIVGEDIPIEARIISAIDSYDAMTNDRPYRRAMSHEEAVEELEKASGGQLDPFVVETFKEMLDERQEKTTREALSDGG